MVRPDVECEICANGGGDRIGEDADGCSIYAEATASIMVHEVKASYYECREIGAFVECREVKASYYECREVGACVECREYLGAVIWPDEPCGCERCAQCGAPADGEHGLMVPRGGGAALCGQCDDVRADALYEYDAAGELSHTIAQQVTVMDVDFRHCEECGALTRRMTVRRWSDGREDEIVTCDGHAAATTMHDTVRPIAGGAPVLCGFGWGECVAEVVDADARYCLRHVEVVAVRREIFRSGQSVPVGDDLDALRALLPNGSVPIGGGAPEPGELGDGDDAPVVRRGGSSNWHSATCPCTQKGCGNDCGGCDCGLPGRAALLPNGSVPIGGGAPEPGELGRRIEERLGADVVADGLAYMAGYGVDGSEFANFPREDVENQYVTDAGKVEAGGRDRGLIGAVVLMERYLADGAKEAARLPNGSVPIGGGAPEPGELDSRRVIERGGAAAVTVAYHPRSGEEYAVRYVVEAGGYVRILEAAGPLDHRAGFAHSDDALEQALANADDAAADGTWLNAELDTGGEVRRRGPIIAGGAPCPCGGGAECDAGCPCRCAEGQCDECEPLSDEEAGGEDRLRADRDYHPRYGYLPSDCSVSECCEFLHLGDPTARRHFLDCEVYQAGLSSPVIAGGAPEPVVEAPIQNNRELLAGIQSLLDAPSIGTWDRIQSIRALIDRGIADMDARLAGEDVRTLEVRGYRSS